MITADETTLEALQALDDAAAGLPSPGSRMIDGVLVNVCGACGCALDPSWVCASCGWAPADGGHGVTEHLYAVEVVVDEDGYETGETVYPETAVALDAIAEAQSLPADKLSGVALLLADCVVETGAAIDAAAVDVVDAKAVTEAKIDE